MFLQGIGFHTPSSVKRVLPRCEADEAKVKK